jgi:hypothetical protein
MQFAVILSSNTDYQLSAADGNTGEVGRILKIIQLEKQGINMRESKSQIQQQKLIRKSNKLGLSSAKLRYS